MKIIQAYNGPLINPGQVIKIDVQYLGTSDAYFLMAYYDLDKTPIILTFSHYRAAMEHNLNTVRQFLTNPDATFLKME